MHTDKGLINVRGVLCTLAQRPKVGPPYPHTLAQKGEDWRELQGCWGGNSIPLGPQERGLLWLGDPGSPPSLRGKQLGRWRTPPRLCTRERPPTPPTSGTERLWEGPELHYWLPTLPSGSLWLRDLGTLLSAFPLSLKY